MKEKKKISLLGAILMGIGCIIGTGIFGSLPEVAHTVGPGIIYALLGAALVVVLRSISRMYTSAAVPVSASSFVHATKLIHPTVGALITINNFLEPVLVSLYGVLFADYFKELFPDCAISGVWISVILLIAFTVLAWFGNKTTISSSNVIVILLLIAIGVYVFWGMSRLDAENISFLSVVKPGMSLSAIAAAAGVMTSSLSGSATCAELADEIEKPERNVPLALILCPVIVAVLYCLMAVVTIGVVPYAEVSTLAQVARNFLSPALLTFFIVGGPIAGILTSLVPIALGCVTRMSFSAKQGLLPAIFCKENKHGVPVLSLFVTSALAIMICATGATFGVIMTIYSFTNNIGELPNTIMPIFAHKKYPKTCDNSTAHMNHKVAAVVAVLTCLIMVYLCVEMAATLNIGAVIGIFVFYLLGYVYYFLRIRYMKKHGVDLVAEMKKPYQPWEDKEASL